MNKLKNITHITVDALQIIHSLDSGKIPLMLFKALVISAVPYVAIVMSAEIINRLSAGGGFTGTLTYALVSVGIIFLLTVLGDWLKKINEVKDAHCYRLYDFSKNEKMMTMDYPELESPASGKLRMKLRTEENMGFGLPFLLSSLDSFFEFVFSAILALALLLSASHGALPGTGFAVFIIIAVALSAALSLLRKNVTDKILTTFKDDSFWPDVTLQCDVMRHDSSHTYKAGKDIRIYGFGDMIHGVFRKTMLFIISLDKKFATKPALVFGAVGASGGLILGGSFLFTALFASKTIELGTIVLLASTLNKLTVGISKAISIFSAVTSAAECLQMYVQFIATPDSQYKGTLPVEKRSDREFEIEFQNVSFKYPGSETYALRGLNLKFDMGKRLAVVGMNGSGKTTMIKLLCRLYDPTEGEILLNGINIAKYDLEQYRRVFSVVFQDFKLFSFTLGENIMAGEDEEGKIEACLGKSGIAERVSSMPDGLDTYLYKDFDEDGVEISGGEAQKIAIARALYKDAPFLVMDEPTAALDPISEYEIYSKLGGIVEDKTAIFISHRLSSCRFCHDIAVFHQGELVQRGAHEELLSDEGGKYFELWNAQAQHYVG